MSNPSDKISSIRLSLVKMPLAQPISDAKVLTGVQKPLTEVALVFCELKTADGAEGMGFSYSKRAGGDGIYAHAREIASNLLGEDPNDIQRLWTKLCWAGASVGRSGLTVQAIAPFDVALWDLKARRAGLSLAKLLGAQRDSIRLYNTSGGFLSTPLEQVLENMDASLASGIGGIKIKVGHPDLQQDLERVAAVRKKLPEHVALMVDANQQWDRPGAIRACRALEPFDLTWIEEPLDAYDATGHAALAAALDTPIATGEMLTSFLEHARLIEARASDFVQPDVPRVGGVTPFLQIMQLADYHGLSLAPHFAMELHVHMAAVYPREPWLEHFEWLSPMFNEQPVIRDGRMRVPTAPGLGISISDLARSYTVDSVEIR